MIYRDFDGCVCEETFMLHKSVHFIISIKIKNKMRFERFKIAAWLFWGFIHCTDLCSILFVNLELDDSFNVQHSTFVANMSNPEKKKKVEVSF